MMRRTEYLPIGVMVMSVADNFRQGLSITALGMVLVFLMLVIVMLAIWVLDRVFSPKPEGEAPTSLLAQAEHGVAPAAQQAAPDLGGQAAAIAVAIELEKLRKQQSEDLRDDADIVGETVTVIAIEAGPGIWRSHGRLKAM